MPNDNAPEETPDQPESIERRRILGMFAGALVTPLIRFGEGIAPISDKPGPADWARLGSQVHGRLLKPASHMQACIATPGSSACADALKNAGNPFFLEDQAGATQSTGWLGAWNSTPSAYCVAAETPQDVAAAVNFARKHGVRLVVKGTGHDYLGRSCAPDSLLVWTHKMRKVEFHERFIPVGAPASVEPVEALEVHAGARWLEAYGEATTKHGRYVQGGGCCSVGACGGFVLGGGFGSFSKKHGTGAAGLLEAEIVTADGKIRIANKYRNADLFWALRGGGGGTFGVVTRMTLLAHPLPNEFGLVKGKITASSEAAFRSLIERMLQFYEEDLNNEHWGEQFEIGRDWSVNVYLTFQGLTKSQVEAKVSKLANPAQWDAQLEVITIPARNMWDLEYLSKNHPDFITKDPRPGHEGEFWWTSNSGEVSKFWYTYQSRWVPETLCRAAKRREFAATLFRASRIWPVSFHINKGLAGASSDAVRRTRETATNPNVFEAAALVILAAGAQNAFPSVPGHKPDLAEARSKAKQVSDAMKLIREATPNMGTYVNEADYFEPKWQQQFWGKHYPRLLAVKRKYDPHNLFRTHHSVGSE